MSRVNRGSSPTTSASSSPCPSCGRESDSNSTGGPNTPTTNCCGIRDSCCSRSCSCCCCACCCRTCCSACCSCSGCCCCRFTRCCSSCGCGSGGGWLDTSHGAYI